MTTPTSVLLLGQAFAIELVDAKHESLDSAQADMHAVGTAHIAQQRILVSSDLGHDQERDTVLHEILHCLCRVINLVPKAKHEERVVVALAPLLLDLVRRNPALVAYLSETPDG